MPRTPKYPARKGRACCDIYVILYGAELFTLQLQITFTLQVCFNAAMPSLLKTRWVGRSTGWKPVRSASDSGREQILAQTEEVHYLQLTAGQIFWIDRQRSQGELKPSLYHSATRNYLEHLLEENDRTTVL